MKHLGFAVTGMQHLDQRLPRGIWAMLGVLVAAHIALCSAYVLGLAAGEVPALFDFNYEANLPTWWASVVLLAIAAVCVGIWVLARASGRRRHRWLLAAAGFVGLSLEEVAQFHEHVGALVGGSREETEVWPLVYLPVLLLGAWVIVSCLADLPRRRALAAGAGLGLYAISVGAELVAINPSLRGSVEVLIEENAEFLGATLILTSLALTLWERWRERPAQLAWTTGRGRDAPAPRWLVWATLTFVVVQAALAIAYVAARLAGERPLRIDLDWEGNVPTWWSSLLMLTIAVLCAVAAVAPGGGRSVRLHWAVAAVAFLGLSMQEVAQAHEAIYLIRDAGVVAETATVTAGVVVVAVLAWALVACVRDLGRPLGGLALAA